MEYFKEYLIDFSVIKKIVDSNVLVETIKVVNNNYYTKNGKTIKNNRALHGDIVYLKPFINKNVNMNDSSDDNIKEEINFDYEVVGIKNRSLKKIVGILHLNKNQKYGITKKGIPYILFTPSSNKYPNFMIPSKLKTKKATYVVISFNKWEIKNKIPIGKVEEVLGVVGNYDVEVDALLFKNYVHPKLKSKLQKSCILNLEEVNESKENIENIKKDSSTMEEIYSTFSVDPKGCRDIDDAFHFRYIVEEADIMNKKNCINSTNKLNYVEVGIHIADVSKWININNIDFTIFSSIYLDNDKQINMLDNNFTYNNASLGNGDIKSAISLFLKYDLNDISKVKSFYFKKVNVKNRALSYDEANNIKEGEIFEFKKFACKLMCLDNKQKLQNYSTDTIQYTKIVEHFMLLYNVYVAETLYSYNKSTILRNHKLNNINKKLLSNKEVKLSDHIFKTSQNSANYIIGSEQIDFDSLQHESLNFSLYTHATSPIRRWVDIINQINIVRYIENKEILSVSNEKIDLVNNFTKNLRKFYNNYEKLKIIFNFNYNNSSTNFDAFIIKISKFKMKIFIPDLNIEHSCNFISKKLESLNIIEYGDLIECDKNLHNEYSYIKINNVIINKYDKIKIDLTILKNEIYFNKKLFIKIITPNIDIF